jgi:uncharacterized DUF497 family protein
MALFDWDKANITHLKRHNVSPEEFEQAMAAFRVDLEAEEIDGEFRQHTIGMTNSGRLLYMIWTMRSGLHRAVTAYTAGPLATERWKDSITQ